MKLFWLALAGAAGALSRYLLAGWVQRFGNGAFPWGTTVVNLTGCFLFGFVWTLAEDRFLIGGQMRMILLVGFAGAFTTFSTFAFETTQMLRDAQWWSAAAYLAVQNVAGVILLVAGLRLGRLV